MIDRKLPKAPKGAIAGDSNAVVGVVAAILLVGAIVMFMVTIRLEYVPASMSNSEANHMKDVSESMAWMKSGLDVQTLQGTSGGAISTPISLGTQGIPFFGIPASTGSLQFFPSQFSLEINASLMTILEQEGVIYGDVKETWTPIVGETVYNVSAVSSFRIRIDQISKSDIGDSVDVNVYDSNNLPVGTITVYVANDPPDFDIFIKTMDSTGTILYDNSIEFHISHTLYNYFIDLLNSEYRFDRLISGASKPLSVLIVEHGLSADYAINYITYSSTGIGTETGGGLNVTDYRSVHGSGEILYSSSNAYYVNQEYIYSGGGLMLNQSDGMAMLVKPPIVFSILGNNTVIGISVPSLSGDQITLSGSGQNNIKTTFVSSNITRGRTANITLVFHTKYAALWEDYIREGLILAGLNESLHQFGITSSGSEVDVYVAGLVSNEYEDIYLYIKEANIMVELGI